MPADAVTAADDAGPVWTPSPARVARANLTRFLEHVRTGAAGAEHVSDISSLHRWSVSHPEAFWPLVWDFCQVLAEKPPGRLPWDAVGVGLDRMAPPDPVLGPRWFPGARLNFAENLLRWEDEREALVFWNETGRQAVLTYRELRARVSSAAAALQAEGIVPGDRVAGYLPNLPETVVAMLATASLGAVWSSCSPDFGVNGIYDRFGQIRPRILIAADGYRYAGKQIDLLPRVREIRERIGGIERVVVVPYTEPRPDLGGIPGAVLWHDWTASRSAVPPYRHLPFDHPLYIM